MIACILHPSVYITLLQKILQWWIPYVSFIPLHSCDYLKKISIKIKRVDWQRHYPKWNHTLNKWWMWSSCTKLALSASWTHGLIAQSVRVSERNLVVVGSNPTQANFLYLLQRILQWWMCVYVYKSSNI